MAEPMTESILIERVLARLGRDPGVEVGPGDDAAVFRPEGRQVVSVDAAVEGIHFPEGPIEPSAIVAKAIGAALSDLAAMGASARQVLVALGLPPGRSPDFSLGLADGIVEVAGKLGVGLLGGDVVASPTLFLSVTAIGEIEDGLDPVTRSGAVPGDLVAVSGTVGGAAAGLALALEGVSPGEEPARSAADRMTTRYLRPEPRLALGPALGRAGVTAMIDLSDGLVRDLGHLARLSGVGIEVEARDLPVEEGIGEIAPLVGREVTDIALVGGEDYELAFSFPESAGEAVLAAGAGAGIPITVIGRVLEGSGLQVLVDGEPAALPQGFEHRF